MNSEIISAWSAAFAESIESLSIEIFDAVIYDKKRHIFIVSSNPDTFAEIMASAEMNSFEEFEDLPDWPAHNEELEKELNELFHTEYLDKIKPLCEKWERHIMISAANFDKHYIFEEDETATEHFTEYFNHFWGREN